MSLEIGKIYIVCDNGVGPELQDDVTFKQAELVVMPDFDLWKEPDPEIIDPLPGCVNGRNKSNLVGDFLFNAPFLILERCITSFRYDSSIIIIQHKILQTFSDDSKIGMMGYASILTKDDYHMCGRDRWTKEKIGIEKFVLWECIPK